MTSEPISQHSAAATATPGADRSLIMTPQQYGVGARFTLSVYDSDYVRIILGALAEADSSGLAVETNDISTFITGSEHRIVEFIADVITAAARSGAHVSAGILLSRGCPGELQCALPEGVPALGADPISLPETGVRARAHWSLYPLLDPSFSSADAGAASDSTPDPDASPEADAAPDSGTEAGSPAVITDHMSPIYAAIEQAKASGVYSGSDHYATRLDGDLAAVLQTAANAWIGVGETVQHVVTHLTVSINSPSPNRD